ncbi:MAG TPA: hypothetical protein VLD67_01715 [Vicinamibacterales bacterium]|nr:hypothetical protein [Vicinamibacterales bacterium]
MHRLTSTMCALMLALGTSSVAASEPIPDALLVPAAKVDSGLGALPHTSQWQGMPWLYATPAEKIDNGLGALPHASQWQGMPWLHATPAEKIDSGLGEVAGRAGQHLTRAP